MADGYASPTLVRGGQLRDEFVCPITRELMKDPVIAADGHTYDRSAIEQWLLNHRRSPKTGEVMESVGLIRNINLLKLIRDLVNEGGEGLYMAESDKASENKSLPGGYRYALLRQKVLTFKCLGPAESSWNGRSFRVFANGVLGGRRRPSKLTERDHVTFSDATVSRRHFEIVHSTADSRYYIRDIGSAGGTFLRIQMNEKIPVFHGLMFMVGKHQMSARDLTRPAGDGDDSTQVGIALGKLNADEKTVTSSGKDSASGVDGVSAGAKAAATGNADGNQLDAADVAEFQQMRAVHSCVLECFAPEGTPMQGRTFEVPRKSVTLGRKQVNDVSFSQMGDDGVCLGIDSSVSGIHSRVEYDEERDALMLLDGSGSKPSTNGTWVRLSKMHEESKCFPLRAGVEVLIGTVRFVTSIDEVIVEKDIREDEALMRYARSLAGEDDGDPAAQAKITPAEAKGAAKRAEGSGKGEPDLLPDLAEMVEAPDADDKQEKRLAVTPRGPRFNNNFSKRKELGGGGARGDKDTATPEFVAEAHSGAAAEGKFDGADDAAAGELQRHGTCQPFPDAQVVGLSEEYGTDDEMPPVESAEAEGHKEEV